MPEPHLQNDRTSSSDDARDGTACLSVTDDARALPFVDREDDLSQIVSFARIATMINRLHLLWLQGEGGIGKSRLLEEAGKRMGSRVAMLRIEFLPGASSSLIESFDIAIRKALPSSDSQTHAASNSISVVLAALRDLVRLQPTLIVLDNVHVLDSRAAADLVTILHGMEHERLGVICISRPGNDIVFGAVLPFVTETIELQPLDLDAIRKLGATWGYDLKRRPRLTRFLHERTRGIPLVIQAALKDLLASRGELARSPVATVRNIGRNIGRSLMHGLTAGLTDEEIDATRRLATLGEIFCVLGAEVIVDRAEYHLQRLQRAGVITQSFRESTPLFGSPSERLHYSFTHSVLHEQLLSEAPPPDDRTLDLLETDVPLYTTTLFVYLAGSIGPDFAPDRIEIVLERMIAQVEDRADSPNWNAALVIRHAAETIYRQYRGRLSEESSRRIRFDLVRLQLRILNAFPSHPDFVAAVDELLAMTQNPQDETSALQRLTALEYAIFRTEREWTFRAEAVFDETEHLVERFPDILLHSGYIILLSQIAGALRASSSFEAIERVRARFDAMIAAAEATGNTEAREHMLLEIAPSFISIFRSPEELEDRRLLAEKIAAVCGEGTPDGRFLVAWPRFLESIGEARRAKEVLARWTPHPLSGYNLSREFVMRLMELVVDAALDDSLEKLERAGLDLLEEFHGIQKLEERGEDITLAQTSVAAHIVVIGVMRGEVEWATEIALRLCENNERINQYMEFERAALTADAETLERLLEKDEVRRSYVPLVRYCIGSADASMKDAAQAARSLLSSPVIQRSNILFVRLVLALVSAGMKNPERSLRSELEEDIRNAVRRCTEWLVERKLAAYLRPLLAEARPFIDEPSGTDVKPKLKGTKPVANRQVQETDSAGAGFDSLVRISMIGTMSFRLPGQKPVKVRGPRPQQLLGLLTANELLAVPLSLADFRLHATGSTSQDESANYLRVLVSRARKQLGADAILTDGESAPRLNYAVVKVDLIEATRLIADALSFARNRKADQAYEALVRGLDLLGSGKPYPGLTDEIFEAAREEFKLLLRLALVETATLLRKTNHAGRADEILTRGLRLLPDDEELRRMRE